MLSNNRPRLRKIVSDLAVRGGLIVMGIIAVPTVILLGVILLIWEILTFKVRKMDES